MQRLAGPLRPRKAAMGGGLQWGGCPGPQLTQLLSSCLLDLSKACRNNSVVREDLQLYYLARNISNQLQCVSNCSFSHPDPFRCDKGSCYIQTDGPNC